MWILLIIAIILIGLLIAKYGYNSLLNYYNKYTKYILRANLSASNVLSMIINAEKLGCFIAMRGKILDNAYSPKNKVVFLSEDVFNSKRVLAVAISLHELGHAIQHKKKSKLFKLYSICTAINKISSYLIIPLVILLIIGLFVFGEVVNIILLTIILSFWLINFVSRICLIFVEKDASKKAIDLIRKYDLMDENEIKISKKLFKKALLTYVGGIFSNILKILQGLKRAF